MTKGQKVLVVFGVAAVLVVGSGLVFAGMSQHFRNSHLNFMGHRQMDGKFADNFLAMAKKHLNLTDAQETQIRALIDAEKPKIQPLMQQLAEAHKALNNLDADGQFNEAAVSDIANRQAATMASLVVEHERLKSQIFGVLTPEQREKAKAFHEHMLGQLHKHLMQ